MTDTTPANEHYLEWQKGFNMGRAKAIEECVRAAQQWLIRAEQGSGEDLIDAIQALKD